MTATYWPMGLMRSESGKYPPACWQEIILIGGDVLPSWMIAYNRGHHHIETALRIWQGQLLGPMRHCRSTGMDKRQCNLRRKKPFFSFGDFSSRRIQVLRHAIQICRAHFRRISFRLQQCTLVKITDEPRVLVNYQAFKYWVDPHSTQLERASPGKGNNPGRGYQIESLAFMSRMHTVVIPDKKSEKLLFFAVFIIRMDTWFRWHSDRDWASKWLHWWRRGNRTGWPDKKDKYIMFVTLVHNLLQNK